MTSKLTFALLATVMLASPVYAFEPTMDIFVETPLTPIFHGSTNLPDGSSVILSLTRPQSGYFGQNKFTIKNGQFKTDQFSIMGRSLNPGQYKIEISMGMASLQPANVQAVIGEVGEKLTGKYALAEFGEHSFDYVTLRQLGGASNATLDANERANAKIALRDWAIAGCTTNLDYVNAGVRSGAFTGREIRGVERQAKIDKCKAEENAKSIK